MNAVAIVTAASKGMGAAIARELHDRGYRLALMARCAGCRNAGGRTRRPRGPGFGHRDRVTSSASFGRRSTGSDGSTRW